MKVMPDLKSDTRKVIRISNLLLHLMSWLLYFFAFSILIHALNPYGLDYVFLKDKTFVGSVVAPLMLILVFAPTIFMCIHLFKKRLTDEADCIRNNKLAWAIFILAPFVLAMFI